MRVGVNCYLLRPDIGGMKQYFATLFNQLLGAEDENTYIFFHFAHNAEELAKLGTDRWKKHALLLKDQSDVNQHVNKFDLYFCPFGAVWPRPIPKPTVVMLPDIQETRYPQFFTPEDRFQRDWHFYSSTRLCDLVITISQFSKQTLVRHHRLLPDKVAVIYPAADLRYYRAAEVARPLESALPPGFVLYPANRWKHKNHDGLLQALHILRSQYNLAIRAVFTGHDAPGGYQLREKAQQYGVGDLVLQVGFLPVEQMAELYGRATFLVFPSLYEGFGIPVVEAMAAGCPVVASSHTSLPEIAGKAALYFDPTSPENMARVMKQAWEDETLRKQLTLLGRARANEYGAVRMAREHVAAFKKAAANYSPALHRRKALYEGYRRRLVYAKRALRLYSLPRLS